MVGEGPNGRCSKDLTPKFKLKLLGERGPKKKLKNLNNHLEEKLDMPYNAFDAKPCHVGKIRFHNVRRKKMKKKKKKTLATLDYHVASTC